MDTENGTIRRWYRLLEGACQLIAVAALIYRAWDLVIKKQTSVSAVIAILPVPALFLLMSMFFRFLSSAGARTGASPFIASILAVFQFLDLTGVHFLVLAVLAVFAVLAAVTDSQQAKELFRFLMGFFAGMQLEKKRAALKP